NNLGPIFAIETTSGRWAAKQHDEIASPHGGSRAHESFPLHEHLPTHRHAMAVAPVGVIVPQRMVLRAAVIPKCNRVRRPLKAHAQLGGLNVPIEHFEYRVAFALAQTDNFRSEEAIHEQAFPTSLGMRPNNRMLGTRIDLSAIVIAIAAAIMLL